MTPSETWILWEIAKSELQNAGYFVEVQYGIMHVRAKPQGMPDRLYLKSGRVSRRSVRRLLNKKEKQ